MPNPRNIQLNAVLPDVLPEFLARMMQGVEIKGGHVGVKDGGYNFD